MRMIALCLSLLLPAAPALAGSIRVSEIAELRRGLNGPGWAVLPKPSWAGADVMRALKGIYRLNFAPGAEPRALTRTFPLNSRITDEKGVGLITDEKGVKSLRVKEPQWRLLERSALSTAEALARALAGENFELKDLSLSAAHLHSPPASSPHVDEEDVYLAVTQSYGPGTVLYPVDGNSVSERRAPSGALTVFTGFGRELRSGVRAVVHSAPPGQEVRRMTLLSLYVPVGPAPFRRLDDSRERARDRVEKVELFLKGF